MQEISLIIPARNSEWSLAACLEAASKLLKTKKLKEIILVDDGSTDSSEKIVSSYPVRFLRNKGAGISAARNTGSAAATTELLWFIDADCIVEETTLEKLIAALNEREVAAVGGGYLNANKDSALANLIQEEFEFRYGKMQEESSYLTGCNLLFRKSVLEKLGGFDERLGATEDGDLSFRAVASGYSLKFVKNSRVRHFHQTNFLSYLKKQATHGYWVTIVAFRHRGKIGGNSYSSALEHAQLALALLFYLGLFFSLFFKMLELLTLLFFCLFFLQLPIAISLYKRSKEFTSLLYLPFSFLRLFARGFGLLKALFAIVLGKTLEGIHFGD